MTKSELIRRISKKTNTTLKQTQNVFDATFEELREILLEGESFSIERFIGFKTVVSKPRDGRNPLTGEIVPIPAVRRVRIVPSLAFKTELKNTPVKNQ